MQIASNKYWYWSEVKLGPIELIPLVKWCEDQFNETSKLAVSEDMVVQPSAWTYCIDTFFFENKDDLLLFILRWNDVDEN